MGSFRHALLYFRLGFKNLSPLIFNVTDQVVILDLKLKDVVMLGLATNNINNYTFNCISAFLDTRGHFIETEYSRKIIEG